MNWRSSESGDLMYTSRRWNRGFDRRLFPCVQRLPHVLRRRTFNRMSGLSIRLNSVCVCVCVCVRERERERVCVFCSHIPVYYPLYLPPGRGRASGLIPSHAARTARSAHRLSHSLARCFSHTLSHALSYTHSDTLSHAHSLTKSLSITHTLSLYHTHTQKTQPQAKYQHTHGHPPTCGCTRRSGEQKSISPKNEVNFV